MHDRDVAGVEIGTPNDHIWVDRGFGAQEGTLDHMRELLNCSADLYAIFDAEDRLVFANPAYCAAYHCEVGESPTWRSIMWRNFRNGRGSVISTHDIDAWLTNALARRASQPFRAFEVALHDGRWIWETETVTPDGRMLLHATDITSVRAESRHLRSERDAARRASWTDPLTGVPNRRYVMDRMGEWLGARQAVGPADFGEHSLAVLDLDNFKRLNDFYGHEIGDSVLVAFCQKVVSHIRNVDLFGRIGGEEFLLFMPNCSLDAARSRLEELQALVARRSSDTIDTTLSYTFSAGVAALVAGEEMHDVIRRADRLLYRAKAEGRARVRSC